MEIERISFFEALKLLADRNGIPMPKRSEFSDPESKLRGALFEMHEIASALYRNNLNGPAGGDARRYLANRGVSGAQAEEFSLGLAADSWDQLSTRLHEERFPPEQLEESGLVMRRQDGGGFYDRFRGRLMFPIHNESGKIIGFGGRALKPGDEPKYLNSPETPIYRKSFVLYNLHRARENARKAGHMVLVEGYMDVIGVYGAGIREVVASCGTALTNTQVRVIKKHSENIVVNFDPDTAGAKAAEKSIQMLLEEGMRVRIAQLEDGLDPDEYVKRHGPHRYQQRLKEAPGYFQWLADYARRSFDMKSAEGRISGLRVLLPAIQRISDRLERAAIAEEVASYLGIERGVVLDEFRRAATERRSKSVPSMEAEIPGAEKLLVNSLLISSEARQEILPKIMSMQVFDKMRTKRILQALAVAGGGQSFSFSDLEGRLNDRERDLLERLIFADDISAGEQALEQAWGCFRALENQNMELQHAALRDMVVAAERRGDLTEAMRLMEELNRANLKRKQ